MKAVRRGAGLICAAAEKLDAGFGDVAGYGEGLFARLDRTGPRDDRHRAASKLNSPRRCGNSDDGSLFFHVAANELVGFADRDALDDPRHGFERADV